MRIHLAAPNRLDTSALRRVIEATGSEILNGNDPDDHVDAWIGTGQSWERVDAVIAVPGIPDPKAQTDVVFIECGVALGRGIPLLVIYSDLYGEDALLTPAWPPSVSVARMSLLATEALDLHIRLFFARISRGGGQSLQSLVSSRPLDTVTARMQLTEIRRREGADRSQALERWAANLFRSSGIELAEPASPDRGFDFVATLSNQAPLMGPIIVEVKSTRSSRALQNLAVHLQQVVVRERAAFGLVILDDTEVEPFLVEQTPLVAIVGAGELLDATERQSNQSVAAVLLNMRNRAAHGL